MNIIGIYIPQMSTDKHFLQGMINLVMTALIMISVLIILRDAIPIWIKAKRESRLGIAV